MKTIKQIADELGVSKTAVRNKIENLGLSEKMETNGNRIEVNERQERLIKSAFSQKKSCRRISGKTFCITIFCSLQILLGRTDTLPVLYRRKSHFL